MKLLMTMALTLLLVSNAIAREVRCDRWDSGHKQRCEFVETALQAPLPNSGEQLAPDTKRDSPLPPPVVSPN